VNAWRSEALASMKVPQRFCPARGVTRSVTARAAHEMPLDGAPRFLGTSAWLRMYVGRGDGKIDVARSWSPAMNAARKRAE
jgi:hypothetical protein